MWQRHSRQSESAQSPDHFCPRKSMPAYRYRCANKWLCKRIMVKSYNHVQSQTHPDLHESVVQLLQDLDATVKRTLRPSLWATSIRIVCLKGMPSGWTQRMYHASYLHHMSRSGHTQSDVKMPITSHVPYLLSRWTIEETMWTLTTFLIHLRVE